MGVQTFRIWIDGETALDCLPGQSVLAALAPVYNKKIISGCHGGGCGVCKIRICEGQYIGRKMSRVHISIEEERQRLALACQVFPGSDLRVEPVGKLCRRLLSEKSVDSQHKTET